MALIKFNDLAQSEALDRKAMLSIRGALGWMNNSFYLPVVMPSGGSVFQKIYELTTITTNNITNIGEMVNLTNNVGINNSGNNATNTIVMLPVTAGITGH